MIKIITSTLLGLSVATGGALASDEAFDYFAGETPLSDEQLSQARGGIDFGDLLVFEFGFDFTPFNPVVDINSILETGDTVSLATIDNNTLETANAASAFTNLATFDPILGQFVFINTRNNVALNQIFSFDVTLRNFDLSLDAVNAAALTAGYILDLGTIGSPF